MISLRNYWLRRAIGLCITGAAIFIPVRQSFAQVGTVVAGCFPSNARPRPNDLITVAINVDMTGVSAPDNLLAAYQATLNWDPAVLQYISPFTPAPPPWNTPIVNQMNVGTGMVTWNQFVIGGSGGLVNIIIFNFRAIGAAGSSTTLDLDFSVLTSSTFQNLLPIATINDCTAQLVTGVKEEYSVLEVPKGYELQQNHPNPFNAGTDIQFALPRAGQIRLEIYNALGAKVRTLVDTPKETGPHRVHWDGTDENGKVVSAGLYAYRLQARGFTAERKMLLVK